MAVTLLAGTIMPGWAQESQLKAKLSDSQTGEPVGFATVSLSRKGASAVLKYSLSAEDGSVLFQGMRKGEYTVKAELMGYKSVTVDFKFPEKTDLGEIRMDPDQQLLDAAQVSAVGNPIVVKKDTIEYNASSFKTTDNDVLEDLLKKLPGVEVSEDGTISVNGQSITKITIDGKTFFLDDPQLASKNLPAKIINKVKVVDKKSEQAEFTGIDDGETETVIDLSIRPGMMKGTFGNVMGGAGHDLMDVGGDTRFQSAGFLGRFTDKNQISVIANANNTNNRGFNDFAGSMMGEMMGGGGMMGRGQGGWGSGNGITTSYMGGGNIAGNLFDDRMELGGNYLYNGSKTDVNEYSSRKTYLDGSTLLSESGDPQNRNTSTRHTFGHRVGMRLEHEFSKNTSIVFEPRINIGGGNYAQNSTTRTSTIFDEDPYNPVLTNDSESRTMGDSKNLSTNGFLLFRQRLGAPGRTVTVMSRYNVQTNEMDGNNFSNTNTYTADNVSSTSVNQRFDQTQDSYSLTGRVTYTEPVARNLYLEANYSYSWNKSESEKTTYDNVTDMKVADYSNSIVNEHIDQNIGVNAMYQNDDLHAQIGFAAMPTRTHNSTEAGSGFAVDTLRNIVNWAPSAMLFWDINDNANIRIFYRGRSNQPSTSQLISVPDNTNPLSMRFGNPNLAPYFSHNFNGDFRFNNRKTFSSFNIRFNGGITQDPIVNATWYTNGVSYSLPVNGPSSANLGGNMFLNLPIAKSGFSIMNMTRLNWSRSATYVGKDIDTGELVNNGALDYNEFFRRYNGESFDAAFDQNIIRSWGATENLRLIYRRDNLELSVQGRTRMNLSNYELATTKDRTLTWNNQVSGSVNWTWTAIGLTIKSDYRYNWYNGYETDQPSENILDAEIQKLLFKDKVTLAVKGYDILGQSKNLSVSDSGNYHSEAVNNTLGRYIIASLTFRFGNFNRSEMRGPGGMGGHGHGHGPH